MHGDRPSRRVSRRIIPVPHTPIGRHLSKVGWWFCGRASRMNKPEQIGASMAPVTAVTTTAAVTAATAMAESTAMAKAAAVSITTAVESEADPNRTVKG